MGVSSKKRIVEKEKEIGKPGISNQLIPLGVTRVSQRIIRQQPKAKS
jgi:hypothetical protein